VSWREKEKKEEKRSENFFPEIITRAETTWARSLPKCIISIQSKGEPEAQKKLKKSEMILTKLFEHAMGISLYALFSLPALSPLIVPMDENSM
jgi:hypothetical protein